MAGVRAATGPGRADPHRGRRQHRPARRVFRGDRRARRAGRAARRPRTRVRCSGSRGSAAPPSSDCRPAAPIRRRPRQTSCCRGCFGRGTDREDGREARPRRHPDPQPAVPIPGLRAGAGGARGLGGRRGATSAATRSRSGGIKAPGFGGSNGRSGPSRLGSHPPRDRPRACRVPAMTEPSAQVSRPAGHAHDTKPSAMTSGSTTTSPTARSRPPCSWRSSSAGRSSSRARRASARPSSPRSSRRASARG